jgi:hypothetical protein
MICPQWSAGDSADDNQIALPNRGHLMALGAPTRPDPVKGKLSRSEFIRRAILHEIERVLTAKLKRTKR